MASVSLFWVFWIRNTIRKVMIVVPVLITSCQVSLKPKIGPVTIHTMITESARKNVLGLPLNRDAFFARREYIEEVLIMESALRRPTPGPSGPRRRGYS
jgi:hypothetical protein